MVLHPTRREVLYHSLLGLGAVGLRALATGIPASVLLNPTRALADNAPACDATSAQYLVLSTSQMGDPVGCDAPGTYLDSGITHPQDPSMAPTPITLGGRTYTAAQPWSSLTTPTLTRTSFIHHGTYTVVHGDHAQVMRLQGAVANNEMMVSLFANALAPCLGCIQSAPVCLGPEQLTYQGRVISPISPAAIATALTLPAGPLKNLQTLRDQTVDALNALYRRHGNSAQQRFIDNYVISQQQARNISENLLQSLASIQDNSIGSQITAAVALIRMNVAPVISINIPFGGDNHHDLSAETQQTPTGITAMQSLLAALANAGLSDKVTFLSLNVFGRGLGDPNLREHNGNHHVSVMIGKNVRSSVIGGVAPRDDDYGATAIQSTSGAADPNGDIPFEQTLAAMGKTVGRALGLSSAYLDANITGGKVITAALNVP